MPGSVPGSGPLVPTFHGFIQNTMDGLMLFEACLSGKLHHVPRRPHDRERSQLIKSGSIFVYEENASGIKRWTDGVAWSPSRILGNFLIYRELEKPFAPGEKKRAMKRKRSFQVDAQGQPIKTEDDETVTPIDPTVQSPLSAAQTTPIGPPSATEASTPAGDNEREMERQLIGSLVDSYGFRPNGLVKKTMSVSVNGVSHHLVSYYNINDVKHRNLIRPYDDARLQNLKIRPELYLKQNFRTPVEETEHYVVDASMNARPSGYGYGPLVQDGGYGMRPGQPMAPPAYHMYAGAPHSATYGGMPSGQPMWQTHAPMDNGYGRQPSAAGMDNGYGRQASNAGMNDGYGRQPSNAGMNDGYGRSPTQNLSAGADGYGRQASIPQAYPMATGYSHLPSPHNASPYPHQDLRQPSPPPSATGSQAPHSNYGAPPQQHSIDPASSGPYSNYRMVYGRQ